MESIVKMNPFECRMWPLHDRLEQTVDEDTCKAEIASFEKHGQLVPVLGRPLKGDPTHKVELIYGARRLFVARYLNTPIAVQLRSLSDREGVIAMDIENRHRKDICAYERGMSYSRWLRSGLFHSQDEIARTVKISASQVSRLLKLAQLPSVVVDVFSCPSQIAEGWGLELMEALEDPARRQPTLTKARELSRLTPRLPATEAYRMLLTAVLPGRKLPQRKHDEVVKGESGRSLFRIKHQRSSIAVVIPLEAVSSSTLEKLRCGVRALLDSAQTTEETREKLMVGPHKTSSGLSSLLLRSIEDVCQ